jgi:hypothetical protein
MEQFDFFSAHYLHPKDLGQFFLDFSFFLMLLSK